MPYVSCAHCGARVYTPSDPAKRDECPVCNNKLPRPRLLDARPLMPPTAEVTEVRQPVGS